MNIRTTVEKKRKIVEKLIQLLYSLNVNYEMYEFDGHQLKKLNENVVVSSAKFEEYPPYYLTKCGKERETFMMLHHNSKFTWTIKQQYNSLKLN